MKKDIEIQESSQMKFIINFVPTWLNIFGRIEITNDLYYYKLFTRTF